MDRARARDTSIATRQAWMQLARVADLPGDPEALTLAVRMRRSVRTLTRPRATPDKLDVSVVRSGERCFECAARDVHAKRPRCPAQH